MLILSSLGDYSMDIIGCCNKGTCELQETSKMYRTRFHITWILYLSYVLLIKPQGVASYELKAPTEYTAFTGSITIGYSIPKNVSLPEGLVQLVARPNNTIVSTIKIISGYNEAEITIACGVVDHAGQFVFRMMSSPTGKALVETSPMQVTWPTFTLSLPEAHVALSKSVTLRVYVNDANCNSVHLDSKYWLELVYFGKNYSEPEGTSTITPKVLEQSYIRQFTKIHNVPIKFQCQLFDQAGIYKVLFKSLYDSDNAIASSDAMRVSWSPKYQLSTSANTIFPCRSYMEVMYSQPDCSNNDDKIRLYMQVRRAESSIASPRDLVYVTERRAKREGQSVFFECDLFHESVVGYCFKYISMARSGAVSEQATHCLPTKDTPVAVVDGVWSSWSPWSTCTVTCGSGKQNRFRACDRPPPSPGGRFCDGNTMDWKSCHLPCTEITTVSPYSLFTPDPRCECGCEISQREGKIVTSTKCPGSILWIIRADSSHVISLTFEIFMLNAQNQETWVKVRDGDSHRDDLLLYNYGESVPRTIHSRKRTLLVEFMAPYHQQDGRYEKNAEGFVAYYKWIVANNTDGVSAVDNSGGQEIWRSTVTLVGIVLCIVIIVATVAFVCHHRMSHKQKKQKQTQGHQALLSNGELPNSPSTSGQSFHGSTNASFADPLSGSPNKTNVSPSRKRDYVMARGMSTHSSTSPVSDNVPSGLKSKSPTHSGRELSHRVNSRYSPHSPVSHSNGDVGTPRSNRSIPSPYTDGVSNRSYHEPHAYKPGLHPESPTKSHRQRKHKPEIHEHQPYSSDDKLRRDAGRSSMDSPSREKPRNQSFKQAIGSQAKDPGAPLADLEDLSPASPASPTRGADSWKCRSDKDKMTTIAENIPMESYYNKIPRERSNERETSLDAYSPSLGVIPSQRPPVEGRDSLGRNKGNLNQKLSNESAKTGPDTGSGRTPTTPDVQNANYIPPAHTDHRPRVKPLPLRSIQRPDGQSPENRTDEPNSNTPSSYTNASADLSPILQSTKLFPDTRSQTPSEFIGAGDDDFEYDDYMPSLPGSYFTMDPHAYTLTWSANPPWSQNRMLNKAGSQLSIGAESDRNSTHC